MSQKSIREYHAKNLISNHLPKYIEGYSWKFDGKLINSQNLNDIDTLPYDKIVCKPDQLFGKRGKNGLVFIAKSKNEAKNWIAEKVNTMAKVIKNEQDPGIEGELTDFIVEPFVEHTSEYYVAIKTERDHDLMYFSTEGGIEVEENWDKVVEVKIPFTLINNPIRELLSEKLIGIDSKVIEFLSGLYQVFKSLDFAYLELNPFVVTETDIVPLDMVARLDSTASYDREIDWRIDSQEMEFPRPFGTNISEVESEIEKLDEKSGSSLKLTILNKNGKVWLLTAGGGASVIYADTVADLGFIDELGNYGEYSGNPSQDETEAYCDLLFKAMFASSATEKKLIIGGGIANFTDVAATFKGIIKSIQKNKAEFLNQKIEIFVRRGGPNYRVGLDLIEKEVKKIGIPIQVNGPEMHMTRVVKVALG